MSRACRPLSDDSVESGDIGNIEFPDPDETDAEWVRLCADWFAGGYFPPEDEFPVSACWPAGEQQYPWESEDAWALVTDVDREAFVSTIRLILTGKDNRPADSIQVDASFGVLLVAPMTAHASLTKRAQTTATSGRTPEFNPQESGLGLLDRKRGKAGQG